MKWIILSIIIVVIIISFYFYNKNKNKSSKIPSITIISNDPKTKTAVFSVNGTVITYKLGDYGLLKKFGEYTVEYYTEGNHVNIDTSKDGQKISQGQVNF